MAAASQLALTHRLAFACVTVSDASASRLGRLSASHLAARSKLCPNAPMNNVRTVHGICRTRVHRWRSDINPRAQRAATTCSERRAKSGQRLNIETIVAVADGERPRLLRKLAKRNPASDNTAA